MSSNQGESPDDPKKPKKKWEPPELRYLGAVRDLVQGAGKTGSNADPDPRGDKPGIG